MNETFIIAGGIFNIAFVIFHIFFWRLFDWKNDLVSLSFINRNVMQVLNLSLTFVFLIFAYLSLFHTHELLSTDLGRSVLILISIFWFFRAIEQVVFFTLKKRLSLLLFMIFILGGFLYGVPVVYDTYIL